MLDRLHHLLERNIVFDPFQQSLEKEPARHTLRGRVSERRQAFQRYSRFLSLRLERFDEHGIEERMLGVRCGQTPSSVASGMVEFGSDVVFGQQIVQSLRLLAARKIILTMEKGGRVITPHKCGRRLRDRRRATLDGYRRASRPARDCPEGHSRAWSSPATTACRCSSGCSD